MSNFDYENLQDKEKELRIEIDEFNKEKEQIKKLIGSIGGRSYSKKDNMINAIFLVIIISLFVLEQTTHWLPEFLSLEVSVLLVSIKIVWMIHSQNKYNHFVFWILNTIEFRINNVSKKIDLIEKNQKKPVSKV